MFVMPLTRPAALVDRLFDETFDRFMSGTRSLAETRTPPLDVVETDSAYKLMLDLPGARKSDIRVSIEGRRVAISTVREQATETVREVPNTERSEGTEVTTASDPKPAAPAERLIHRERTTVAYARTVVLPAEVDTQASQAAFDNGVLTLTLAKKAPNRATQLTVA